MFPPDRSLTIGGFIYDGMQQLDFTGPFDVLSRLPNSTFHVFGKTMDRVTDVRGLVFSPTHDFASLPPLDVLIIPGGNGVNALMEDESVLDFLRRQAGGLACLFSICTGSLLLGAAGLLKGRRATTHWASFEFLECFGATPVDERVVVDGNLVTAAGVTSGIDGALVVASKLRDDEAAQAIQLYLEYTPTPPFHSGGPKTAPPAVLASVRHEIEGLIAERRAITRRVAGKLGERPL